MRVTDDEDRVCDLLIHNVFHVPDCPLILLSPQQLSKTIDKSGQINGTFTTILGNEGLFVFGDNKFIIYIYISPPRYIGIPIMTAESNTLALVSSDFDEFLSLPCYSTQCCPTSKIVMDKKTNTPNIIPFDEDELGEPDIKHDIVLDHNNIPDLIDREPLCWEEDDLIILQDLEYGALQTDNRQSNPTPIVDLTETTKLGEDIMVELKKPLSSFQEEWLVIHYKLKHLLKSRMLQLVNEGTPSNKFKDIVHPPRPCYIFGK